MDVWQVPWPPMGAWERRRDSPCGHPHAAPPVAPHAARAMLDASGIPGCLGAGSRLLVIDRPSDAWLAAQGPHPAFVVSQAVLSPPADGSGRVVTRVVDLGTGDAAWALVGMPPAGAPRPGVPCRSERVIGEAEARRLIVRRGAGMTVERTRHVLPGAGGHALRIDLFDWDAGRALAEALPAAMLPDGLRVVRDATGDWALSPRGLSMRRGAVTHGLPA